MMALGRASPSGGRAMVHDLVLALVFLAMIIAPAIVTIPSERDEKDSL
jgi:hypothetical protein